MAIEKRRRALTVASVIIPFVIVERLSVRGRIGPMSHDIAGCSRRKPLVLDHPNMHRTNCAAVCFAN